MKAAVSLDRETYLPGEAAQITFTVTNPASKAVVSLTPFLGATSCVGIVRKVGDQSKQAGPSSPCWSAPIDSSNTAKFGPGETKQLVLNSYDKLFGLDSTTLFSRSMPASAGKYAIVFRYGTSPSARRNSR